MSKSPMNIEAFGGLDTRHTRSSSRLSAGKNFLSVGGSIKTRLGSELITSSFTAPVVALFKAGMPTLSTRLLVQEGQKLWHRIGTAWTVLKADLSAGKVLRGARFVNKLVMVNGVDKLQYDIATGVLSSAAGTGDTAMPSLEYLINWKSRLFGWAPNYAGSNFLRFCGYNEADPTIIDPTVWPPDFTLDISGESSSPILAVMPVSNHLLCLSKNNFWQVFGNTEVDFSINHAGNTNVYSTEVCKLVGDVALWLGVENGKNVVYQYTGTSPTPISSPIEELIQDLSLTNVEAMSFQQQYWLVFKDTVNTKSKVFVYDLVDGEWFYFEYPFVISAGLMYGDYLTPESLIVGTTSNTLVELNESSVDVGNAPILTEFVLGPFNLKNREFKAKTIYINCEAKGTFTFVIQVIIDGVVSSSTVVVTAGEGTVMKKAKIRTRRGSVCSIKVTSSNKINEIQEIGLTLKPKAVK